MSAICLRACVADAVAVGAHEEAFLGLPSSPLDTAEETAKRELLGPRVAMVELQRPDGPLVAAILAAPTSRTHEFGLHPDPSPPAVVDPGLAAANPRVIQRPCRRVVRAGRRALEGEPAAAEKSRLSVDHD